MPEYQFSVTRIFLYKNRILDCVLLILENAGHNKPVFSHILRSVFNSTLAQCKLLLRQFIFSMNFCVSVF